LFYRCCCRLYRRCHLIVHNYYSIVVIICYQLQLSSTTILPTHSSYWLSLASMAGSSTPVTPFYEPGAPPLPIPVLLAHTELADPLAPSLIDNEPLFRSATRFDKTASKSQTQRARTPTSRYPITFRRNGWSPTPKISTTANCSPDSAGSGSDDLSDSDAASDSSMDLDDAKIQKPPGESGRPGRGGYNLEAALGWNPKQYNKLKVNTFSV
jgi:hypothetical protein